MTSEERFALESVFACAQRDVAHWNDLRASLAARMVGSGAGAVALRCMGETVDHYATMAKCGEDAIAIVREYLARTVAE